MKPSIVLAALIAAFAAPVAASNLNCTFTKTCSPDTGGCDATKVSYGVTSDGGAWTVRDVYNGVDISDLRVETLENATSLRWRAGGLWRDEAALTEIVLAADGAAALSSIGMADGALGATVMTGRCDKSKGAGSDR
ncbi:MAG: hypothetical protein AAFN79_13790 [Pseudomonadota bacterium]